MDKDRLVANARHDSVTVERLTDPVIEAIDEGEQPHGLLTGNSADIRGEGGGERLFASVGGHVSTVVTDRHVHVVVPTTVGAEIRTTDLAAIQAVETETTVPRSILIRTPDRTFDVHVADDEDPTPIADLIRDGPAPDSSEPSATDSGTAAGGAGADATGQSVTDGAGTGTASMADVGGASSGTPDPLDTLERLDELRKQGIISDEEFEAKKAELLDQL